MNVTPLDASFGATVTDLKLTDLDDGAFQALYDTWLRYSLLVFPGQHLDSEQQVAFTRRFGPLEPKLELYEFSNITGDGTIRTAPNDDMIKILKGNMDWHQDSTYTEVQTTGTFTLGTTTAKSQAPLIRPRLETKTLPKQMLGLRVCHTFKAGVVQW